MLSDNLAPRALQADTHVCSTSGMLHPPPGLVDPDVPSEHLGKCSSVVLRMPGGGRLELRFPEDCARRLVRRATGWWGESLTLGYLVSQGMSDGGRRSLTVPAGRGRTWRSRPDRSASGPGDKKTRLRVSFNRSGRGAARRRRCYWRRLGARKLNGPRLQPLPGRLPRAVGPAPPWPRPAL